MAFPDLDEIRRIVHDVLPRCFAIKSVDLEYGDAGGIAPDDFDVHVRLVRVSDDLEPHGWGYELSQRIRARWGPSEFRFSTTVLADEPADEEAT